MGARYSGLGLWGAVGLLVLVVAFGVNPTSPPIVSGTTKIGKYVLNHSFVIPGVVATAVAVITGLFLVRIMF